MIKSFLLASALLVPIMSPIVRAQAPAPPNPSYTPAPVATTPAPVANPHVLSDGSILDNGTLDTSDMTDYQIPDGYTDCYLGTIIEYNGVCYIIGAGGTMNRFIPGSTTVVRGPNGIILRGLDYAYPAGTVVVLGMVVNGTFSNAVTAPVFADGKAILLYDNRKPDEALDNLIQAGRIHCYDAGTTATITNSC